jgi:hypothetical protein
MDQYTLESRVRTTIANPELDTLSFNQLLSDLADAKETEALIRIWDVRGTHVISPGTMESMERLHNLGKGKIPRGTIILPTEDSRRRLPAARRLHKIFKGRILSARSDAAKEYIVDAADYLIEHPEIKAMKKSDQIKELKNHFSIPNDTARGIVTKLKQKKLL